MFTGAAKAWHIHHHQIDWWYVGVGTLKVALYDTRPDSPTHGQLVEFLMGDNLPAQVVRIPPAWPTVAKQSGPRAPLYITSSTYDPTDEGRIPHDSPEIGYDWTALPPIK